MKTSKSLININPIFSNLFEINFFNFPKFKLLEDNIISYKWNNNDNNIHLKFNLNYNIENNKIPLLELLFDLSKNKIKGKIILINFFKDGTIFRNIEFENIYILDIEYLNEGSYEISDLGKISAVFNYDSYKINEINNV